MKNLKQLILLICTISTLALVSCEQDKTTTKQDETVIADGTTFTLAADKATERSEGLEEIKSGDATLIASNAADQALTFKVNVPAAGRYRVEAKVAYTGTDTAAIWIEDYVGNKDGRTYNVTGNMYITNTGDKSTLTTIKREGSPLNKGEHPMKIHFKQAGITLKDVKFTLMKAHQETPLTLTQKTDGKKWEVVWSDEFDGTGIVDTSKWTYDIGDWGWGNNELQYYTEFQTKNARQEDGNLIIESHKNDGGNAWTSARLTTRGKVTFLYGKIEMRVKVPPKRGTWAAAWTLGDNYVDELSWPYCGEIDIVESVGYETDDKTGDGSTHATIHCGAYYFKIGNQPTSILPIKDMVNTFHTYAIEWTPQGIKAFVDDKQYFEYKDTSTELAWPYDKPQNIILNLAMGGGWGGAKGMDDSYDSQQYIIDYVRVSELR